MVVVLGEAVSLVADVLQQPQSIRVAAEDLRIGLTGQEHFFLALGEGQRKRRLDVESTHRVHGGVELTFASVDQQQVGKPLALLRESTKPTRDDFVDRSEIVDAFHCADFVALVAVLEWQAVDELDETGDCLAALQMRDVDSLDDARQVRQAERFAEPGESFFRVDVKDLGLSVFFEVTSQVEIFERFNRESAQPARTSALSKPAAFPNSGP